VALEALDEEIGIADAEHACSGRKVLVPFDLLPAEVHGVQCDDVQPPLLLGEQRGELLPAERTRGRTGREVVAEQQDPASPE
jgi:hypothetical protein